MKQYILSILVLSVCMVACENKDNKDTKTTASSTSSVALPYQATYGTEFTNDVSDADLLTVLNSYKYWETGDLKAMRSILADSVELLLSSGWKFNGTADSLMKVTAPFRDSLSSASIQMITWLKNHSVKDSSDWVNVWYKEIDTYKTGKVDSAEYEDDNMLKNGKIVYTSSHRMVLK